MSNLMHDCIHLTSQENQQLCRASYVTTSYLAHVSSFVGCEKSRCHVCRGFSVFLVFVAG